MAKVTIATKADAIISIKSIDIQLERLRRRWAVTRGEAKRELMDIIDAALDVRIQFMKLRDG